MIKYVKGNPVEAIHEQVFPLSEGVPDMIAAQHTLHDLLKSYLSQQFFPFEESKPKKQRSEA